MPLKSSELRESIKLGFGAITGELPGYSCPRCKKNWGYFWFDKEGCEFFCGEDECLRLDKLSSLGKSQPIEHKDASVIFGKGTRYFNACLANWMADEFVKKQVSEWLRNPHDMIILLGAPETGKTYFCMALANYLFDQKKEVKYYDARRIFERVQEAIKKDHNQYAEVHKIARAEVLIIDDLGAGMNTEWQKEIMLDLIDQRYSEQKITIVTSNLSWDAMKDALGERISRRLQSKENLKLIVG